MLTSVTRNPTKFSTRLITLLRTASETCGMDLPYSTASERSTAVSSSPTSTVTPRVVSDPPLTLSRTPPTAREVPPPICTPSTSCAAMPVTWETTALLMVVLPRSVLSGGLSCCRCLPRVLRSVMVCSSFRDPLTLKAVFRFHRKHDATQRRPAHPQNRRFSARQKRAGVP